MSMIKLLERIFGKRKKELEIPGNIYYLSMLVDRENQEHLNKMELFIKMLNDQSIEWKTFASLPTMMSIHNKDRFGHFNVCVDVKYKIELENIHKEVYGF